MRNKMPAMEGFYKHDPQRPDESEHIELFEITSALGTISVILSETIDGNDLSRNEGLSNAMRVLVRLLRQRETGEEVVKKPQRARGQPRPKRKPSPNTGTVVQLVRESKEAANA